MRLVFALLLAANAAAVGFAHEWRFVVVHR
jgi:hypothetical protein